MNSKIILHYQFKRYFIMKWNCHLVILLNDGTYKCSCMSLVNRGIVCRHYFSIMLRTSQARFHIGFLNPRWFVQTHLDFKDRLFYPASKFEADLETPFLEPNNTP